MISKSIQEKIQAGSMIRKMFEEGNRLKKEFGAENVFDFSIGNPDVAPPSEVQTALKKIASDDRPGIHGYMSNNGYLSTRQVVAGQLTKNSNVTVSAESICMTVGAAGAMNAVLKAILDPGDEVILLAPFFMEYRHYVDNHGGKSVIVQTDPKTFEPHIEAIRAAISPRTKALIINSPNNPTGVMYSADTLKAINHCVNESNQLIHVISDEPYRELVFDGLIAPSTLDYIDSLIICYSWSKSLSLPGERIGYAAVSPKHADFESLCPAIVFCNRILGSVNAPALFQRVIEDAATATVNVDLYEKRRDMLYDIVRAAGFECVKPSGAFYLFVKSPEDDMAFATNCAKHNLLVVPGSAFSMSGYFRLAFCVSEKTIQSSANVFKKIGQSYGLV